MNPLDCDLFENKGWLPCSKGRCYQPGTPRGRAWMRVKSLLSIVVMLKWGMKGAFLEALFVWGFQALPLNNSEVVLRNTNKAKRVMGVEVSAKRFRIHV